MYLPAPAVRFALRATAHRTDASLRCPNALCRSIFCERPKGTRNAALSKIRSFFNGLRGCFLLERPLCRLSEEMVFLQQFPPHDCRGQRQDPAPHAFSSPCCSRSARQIRVRSDAALVPSLRARALLPRSAAGSCPQRPVMVYSSRRRRHPACRKPWRRRKKPNACRPAGPQVERTVLGAGIPLRLSEEFSGKGLRIFFRYAPVGA